MSDLRQQALELLETMPEEVLANLIQFMQAEKLRQINKAKRLEEKRIAFEELKSLSKSVPDLDEDKARSEYWEEKLGYENFS